MLRAMTAPVAHVLVVEDEAAIAETVLYALRSEGYAASHCLLGSEALQRLQAGGIDLLVLDVGLPDLGGFEVCRRLRGAPAAAGQTAVIF
ncbi:response regulator, partial [Stenotrophomonas maltophilia]|uniref:response regulator n=1 Tax=Stenotrophomonas maltophilia TaxID=40324 RepID=UPI002ACC92DF